MILKALLVSKDDQAAETLTQVLANFGVAVDRSSAADVAVARLEEEHFDQIVVDFDDPGTASLVSKQPPPAQCSTRESGGYRCARSGGVANSRDSRRRCSLYPRQTHYPRSGTSYPAGRDVPAEA